MFKSSPKVYATSVPEKITKKMNAINRLKRKFSKNNWGSFLRTEKVLRICSHLLKKPLMDTAFSGQ